MLIRECAQRTELKGGPACLTAEGRGLAPLTHLSPNKTVLRELTQCQTN